MQPAIQLERLLQSQGFGSRKVCRELIRQGHVMVAGEEQTDPARLFSPEGLVFQVDDETWEYRKQAYLMLNKPAGYECSRAPHHHPSVLALIPEPLKQRGVQPAGRLDEDTTGLLLLSDDGDFIHRLIAPKRKVTKVYAVTAKHAVTTEMVEALLKGVLLHDETYPVAALACEQTGEFTLNLTLSEGRYHQVKRMLGAAGNRVASLRRIQVGGLALPDDLAEGEWRWLSPVDLQLLQADEATTIAP